MYKKGQRVELISTTDEYTTLVPGDKGTVRLVDDIGTIHINWDNGNTLGMIPGEDQIIIIDE
jgi:hypothetical protein